jgi:hypothetical protein
MGEWWAQGKGEWGCIWWMCFVSMYENRRVKPVEIVLRREEGGSRQKIEGINPTKIYCKHICKYHSVSTCITIISK